MSWIKKPIPVKDQLKSFFDNPITSEDTIILMNTKNKKTFIKFIEQQKARLLLERMSQIWEDKEYVFSLQVLWRLVDDLNSIFWVRKEFKLKKIEEEKEKQSNS